MTNNFECPWSKIIAHASTDKCSLNKIRVNSHFKYEPTVCKHIFTCTSYSINNSDGTPTHYNEESLYNAVNCSNFKIVDNSLKCSVETIEFNLDDFTHILQHTVYSLAEFWNIVSIIINFWTRYYYDKHHLYPHYNTVCDVLINTKNPEEIVFLRPVKFNHTPTSMYAAFSHIIYNLFVNSSAVMNPEPGIRPRKMFCNDSCLFKNEPKNWWNSVYQAFGKNNYIHTVCCTRNPELLNTDWMNFVSSLVEFRKNEINDSINKSKHKNQLIKLHKLWYI